MLNKESCILSQLDPTQLKANSFSKYVSIIPEMYAKVEKFQHDLLYFTLELSPYSADLLYIDL